MPLPSFKHLLVTVLFLPSALSPAPAQRRAAPAPPVRRALAAPADLEPAVAGLVNEYRQRQGLAPLRYDDDLAALARRHSQNMAAGHVAFGHDGFDERSDAYARTAKGVLRGFAENVAYGSETAEAVMEQWLQSSGHRKNIQGSYNYIGIGVARAPDGTLYFTQLFARR